MPLHSYLLNRDDKKFFQELTKWAGNIHHKLGIFIAALVAELVKNEEYDGADFPSFSEAAVANLFVNHLRGTAEKVKEYSWYNKVKGVMKKFHGSVPAKVLDLNGTICGNISTYIAGKYASNFKAQWTSNIRLLWKARKHLDEENLVRREFENVFQGLVKTKEDDIQNEDGTRCRCRCRCR